MAAMGMRVWALLQLFLCISLQVSAFNVKGATEGVKKGGEAPVRPNISTLQNSGPAWDLYIQAIKELHDHGESDMLSGYRVTGIHGLPYRSWDGVEGSRQAGYCAHGSTLFPFWHRPYLALYEQLVSKIAQNISEQYPKSSRAKYVQAAKTLRIPYWDWASDPELPSAATTEKIEIETPKGKKSISNPLYSYKFDPTPKKGFPADHQLIRLSTSVRQPDASGRTRLNVVQEELRSYGPYLRQSTYQLLTSEKDYTTFSTHSLPGRPRGYNNIETVHNTIHVAVGGDRGHMTYVPWSAYDPIFWIHHTSVDRIVALWQVINPDSFVKPSPSGEGTMMQAAGTVQDANTPLWPFHSSDNKFYTANSVRDIKTFGYTYPELEGSSGSKSQQRRHVMRKVNELYNPGSSQNSGKRRREGEYQKGNDTSTLPLGLDKILKDDLNLGKFFDNILQSSLLDFDKLRINNMKKQWAVNIKVNKFAISEPFQIRFFLGKPPKDAQTWSTASNLVGTFSLIAHSTSNPTDKSHHVYGQIPISHALAEAREKNLIDDITDKIIVPLLKTHLEWRVQTLSGKEVDMDEFVKSGGKGALEICVAERDVKPLEDKESDSFPEVGEWNVYEEATKGKTGGSY